MQRFYNRLIPGDIVYMAGNSSMLWGVDEISNDGNKAFITRGPNTCWYEISKLHLWERNQPDFFQ